METRTKVESKVYILWLNTFGRSEDRQPVAIASSEEILKKWYESQFLEESEVIDGLRYSFKEGHIRCNNPLYSWKNINEDCWGHGWQEVWVDLNDLNNNIYRIDC